jgi:siderophore synthetase component
MVIDYFRQRLLDKIDQEIAEAERLLQLQPQLSAADAQAPASSERLQQFLIQARERRRSVRRQFLAREQSFTDSLVLGSSMQQGHKELPGPRSTRHS